MKFCNVENVLTSDKIKTDVVEFLSEKGLLSDGDKKYMIFPGFCDVHVHLREPGFSYKETIKSGTAAALHGGYTAICAMPNLNPVPDSPENLEAELSIIMRDALVDVYPYGSVTRGEKGQEISDMEGISDKVCAFSDDGVGVQNEKIMETAMVRAARLGKIVAAHCETESLLFGGSIHDGEYLCRFPNCRGISSESEYSMIERDLGLVKSTGCRYHVCHVSTKEGVELIRKAKRDGLDVSCETAPHYLTLCDRDLRDSGDFKMNPPLRSFDDMTALREGICDGTVDMIATDHAPHSKEEKAKGLAESRFGIVGLETAFPVLYTELVLGGIVTAEKLAELLSVNPRKRFGIPTNEDYTVFEVSTPYKIDPTEFLSMGKSTPFAERRVYGKCVMTTHNGKTFTF